jgi:hypothetical protein
MSRTSTTSEPGWLAPTDRLSTLPTHEPAFTLGYEAISWAEHWLIQPNGPRAGRRLRFTRDQLLFLLHWYSMTPDGRWVYDYGVRRLAKGSGKSPFAGILALIEFCAPVRLARKDDRLPGGCVGRPVDLPLVQLAATAESQTKNTMRMVRAYAPKGSSVVVEHEIDVGKTVYYRVPEGTLEVITSSATAAEGAEVSFVVKDETEHWKPANGGPDLSSTIDDNLVKNGARALETANAWEPGIDSVAETSWDAWVAQEEGRTQGDGLILYDARMAPPTTDLADVEQLESALRFVYADCDWKRDEHGELDVQPIMRRIWSLTSRPSESKRKYLNRPTAHEDAWVDPEQWSACAQPARVIEPSEPVVLFFDGSKSRDTTAVVACAVSDGHVFVPRVLGGQPAVWTPQPSHDTDDVVPVADVDLALDEIFDNLNVVAFFADVAEWESFVKVEWPRRFADRLPKQRDGSPALMAVAAGRDPQLIAWDMRSHVRDFTLAAELVESEIVDRKFTHDATPVLTHHVTNCRRRPNRWGISVAKESPSSSRKIDAAVCLIGARLVRRQWLAAQPKRKPRSGVVQGVR